jgi:hypothetical protein
LEPSDHRPRIGPRPPEKKEVFEMAASLVIEEESGTTTGRIHPHNGYYAGDFSTTWQDAGTSGSRH